MRGATGIRKAMIRTFDHYHPGQRRKRLRVILIPTLSVVVVLGVALLVVLGVPGRLFGTGGRTGRRGSSPTSSGPRNTTM